MTQQVSRLPKQQTQPLVIDGLNCAAVTREQFERTLEGGITAINLTAVQPWSDLPSTLKELEASLSAIEAMEDIALIVRTVDDIELAHREGKLGVIIGAQNSLMVECDVKLLATFK